MKSKLFTFVLALALAIEALAAPRNEAVDLVVISFPDCEKPESLAEVKDSLSSLGGGPRRR